MPMEELRTLYAEAAQFRAKRSTLVTNLKNADRQLRTVCQLPAGNVKLFRCFLHGQDVLPLKRAGYLAPPENLRFAP